MSNYTDYVGWNTINLWYYIPGGIISIMLCISEALAWWDKCPANAITQLYKCVYCNKEDSEIDPSEWENRIIEEY